MSAGKALDLLREAQEAVYEAEHGVKQDHWRVVWKSAVQARALLDEVRLEAHRRLAKESEAADAAAME